MNKKYEIDGLLISESLRREVIDMTPHARVEKVVMESINMERKILGKLLDILLYRGRKKSLVLKSSCALCLILSLLIFTVSPIKSFASESFEKLMYWVTERDSNGKITKLVQVPADDYKKRRDTILADKTYLSDEEISSLVGYSVSFPQQLSNGYVLFDKALAVNQSTKVQVPFATYWNLDLDSKVFIEITKEDRGYRNISDIKTYQKNGVSFYLSEFESPLYSIKVEDGVRMSDKTQKPTIYKSCNLEFEKDGIFYHLDQFPRDSYNITNDEMIALAEDFALK